MKYTSNHFKSFFAGRNPHKYREMFLNNLRNKYPNLSDEELYKQAMEDYDNEHDYAKRSREDLQEFAEMVKVCPNIAMIYSGWLAYYQNGDNPDLALLDIDQRLKDLIAGKISIEEYNNL